ncbi:MAG: hypothetical protein V1914_03685 [archaeon]
MPKKNHSYLSESTGFIKEMNDNTGRKYITLTDKGFNYLNKYLLIQGFINDFEL